MLNPRPFITLDGPAIDIVGDVHGQFDALIALLSQAGWHVDIPPKGHGIIDAVHPQGRKLVFVGDLVNRGPKSVEALRLLRGLQRSGNGVSVCGNHDADLHDALRRKGRGAKSATSATLASLKATGQTKLALKALSRMPHQLRIRLPRTHPLHGDGYLSVVHAAAGRKSIDCNSAQAMRRSIHGYPESSDKSRKDWALHVRTKRWIVHGHTPGPVPAIRGRAIGLDTAAGQEGRLTMLRLDTLEFLSHPVQSLESALAA